MNNAGLISLIIYELIIFAILVPFLRLRNWNIKKFGINPGIKDTLTGVLLFFIVYIIYIAVYYSAEYLFPSISSSIGNVNFASSDISLVMIILVSIINPIFEEIFVCAYVIESLKNIKGISFAINISILIRLSYHLYQGPNGIILLIPLGVIFAIWYSRTKRLWPIIVAHAIFDITGFLNLQ